MENDDGCGPPRSRPGSSRSPPERAPPRPTPRPERRAEGRRNARQAIAAPGIGASGPERRVRGRNRDPRRRHRPEIADLAFGEALERIREGLDEREPLLNQFRARVAEYGRLHPELRQRSPVVIPDPEIRDRIGEIPVAALPDEPRSAMTPAPNSNSETGRVVWLSPETAMKQLKHEDERHSKPLRARHYRRLPEAIAHGEWEPIDDRHLAFYHRIDGDWFRVVVKQTAENEIYLKTFHRCDRNRVPSRRPSTNPRKRRRTVGPPPRATPGNPT